MMDQTGYKSGFISLIGRPNVGKSTLINQIIGEKISIISDKAQTTRNRISGIYTTESEQMVFIDTPGVHKPKHRLGDFMNDQALTTLNEVDVVLFLVNASQKRGPGDTFIMERLEQVRQPVFLVINQIDKVHPDDLPAIAESYTQDYEFAEVMPISAANGNNVKNLLETVAGYLPEGPQYYPEDQVTDHPESFIIKEIIREKILELTREEIPHSTAIVIDDIFRNDDDKLEIRANIVIERSSQKGIIIGKKGSMLKEIGKRARRELEGLLGEKIYLDLWVRVKSDWRDRDNYLTDFGYNRDDY